MVNVVIITTEGSITFTVNRKKGTITKYKGPKTSYRGKKLWPTMESINQTYPGSSIVELS